MNETTFPLAGATLTPLPAGALWWADRHALAVGDLHLGRAERTAREGGALLPPYETMDTLNRLDALLARYPAKTLILLGDSFDDMQASAGLGDDVLDRILQMAAGRELLWIAGNHDPGPVNLPGTHLAELVLGPLTFRHVAEDYADPGEVSGHFHPKVRLWLRGTHIARPCFLVDARRVILPAFGTYTGGLDACDPVFDGLMDPRAVALVTGRQITALSRGSLKGATTSRVRGC